MEKSLLMGHMDLKKTLRFVEVTLILKAIQAAGVAAAGGTPGDSLTKLYQMYQDLLFPEKAAEKAQTAVDVGEILKREVESGPMQVQAQSYRKPKKR